MKTPQGKEKDIREIKEEEVIDSCLCSVMTPRKTIKMA
jgi:hypothetical protein